nr:immunoglobulin heavy chain junction region [Macaca mulatta]
CARGNQRLPPWDYW